MNAEVEARFWAKVDKSGGCWEWTASRMGNGYGRFTYMREGKRRWVLPHRLSYEIRHGYIPEGMEIDHTCYNRACVNPDHLRVTTRKQNVENRPGAQANSKTGVRGVSIDKYGRFAAYGTHHGKGYRIGSFDTIEEAAEAARLWRLSHFTHNDADRKDAA